jgi:hypothetical protein
MHEFARHSVAKAPSLHKRHDDSRTGQPDTEPDNGQEQEPVSVKDPAVEEVVVAVHAG